MSSLFVETSTRLQISNFIFNTSLYISAVADSLVFSIMHISNFKQHRNVKSIFKIIMP